MVSRGDEVANEERPALFEPLRLWQLDQKLRNSLVRILLRYP